MSVPPEMELSWIVWLIDLYTKSNPSTDKGDPVVMITRKLDRSTLSFGAYPELRTASIYLADTPK